MDELDRRLIIELQANPRKSNARLAKSLGIAEHTVSKRIKHFVSLDELIFTALPDMKRFGYPTSAYIGLKITQNTRSFAIAEQLCQSPDLRWVSTCEGFADLIIRGEFTSDEELADFVTDYLGNIEGISRIDTMVELKKVKRRTFSSLRNRDATRMTAQQTGDIVIDAVDRRLILELQKDSRAPLKKLAQTVDMSEMTVSRRIKNLVASGAIELTAILNTSKSGYPAHGIIGIEAEIPELARVAESIACHPQISFVGIYSGPVQIIAGIHASSPEDFLYLVTQELVKTEGIIRLDLLIHSKVFKQVFSWLQQ
jgi:DNA-binding Lrp family transcriptional regulator